MKKKIKKRKLKEKIAIIIEARKVFLNPINGDIQYDLPLERATYFDVDEKSASTTVKTLIKTVDKIIKEKNKRKSSKKIHFKFMLDHLIPLETIVHNKKKP